MPVRTYLNMVDACLKPRSFMSDILNTEGEEGWKEGRAVIKSFSCELEEKLIAISKYSELILARIPPKNRVLLKSKLRS